MTRRPSARTIQLAIVGLVGVLALGACGGSDQPDRQATPSASSTGSSPGNASPTTPASPSAGEQTFIGQVGEGVEGGCLVLRAQEPTATYGLVGDTSGLAPGQQVQLTGVVEPDTATTCQQGPALRVTGVQSTG